MIYLRSSRRGGAALGAEADALDRDYLDALIRLNEPSGLRLTIEASNGTELQGGIKETTLSARLFAQNGTDLTVHLPLLALTWEIWANGGWEEVGTGWSYRAGIRNEYRNTYRARTTHLEVAKTLGEEVTDAGLRRILQELVIASEITITNTHALIAQIPTADLIKDRLKQDRQFLVSVKGDKGDSVTLADLNIRWDDDKLLIGGAKSESLKGQDAPPIRPNLLHGFMRAEKLTSSAAGSANVHTRFGVKPFLEPGKRYVLSADFELTEGTANAVSIGLLTTSGTFLSEAKNPLNGTKTRVSLQISLDASANLEEIVDVLGYAGERGKTRGNIAKYYNIKLEEVTNDSDKASAYLPHPDDLKGADGKSITLEDLKIKWEGDRLNIAGYKSDSLTGSAGKDAVPVRPNLFDFACLAGAHQKIGLSFDDLTAKRKLSPLSVTIRQTPDTSRLCTGVALQFDINVRRAQKESGKFTRRATLRIMRGESALAVSNGEYISEQAGTYHYEVVRSISKVIAQHEQGFYVHAWITDYGAGLLDCEVSNIKIEYLYEGEPQQCSIYTPNSTDMIPLPPRIIEDRWYIADRLTHKYIDSGIKALGIDGKSVTAQEVTATLKGDSAFLASVKGDKGDRGLQGIKGLDGRSVTPEEAVDALMQDQASLHKIRSNVLSDSQTTEFVNTQIRRQVTQAVTLSDNNNTMRLPDIHTIEEGALYRIAIIPNGYCLLEFEIVSSQDIITPMFNNLGRHHTQKALFCDGAFALFERLGERWMWRNYCDFAYHKNKIQKELEELRLSTIEDNIRALRNGAVNSFVNLGSIQSGSYHLKPSDYIIFARATGNGDKNPWIYLDDASIEVGANFFVIVPSTDITCELKVPPGTAINGNTQVNKGLYLLIKTWENEWICTSISTM